MLLRSSLLCEAIPGLVHGFSTRHGGVSAAPFDSLNTGAKWGDDPAAVEVNLGRIADAGPYEPERLVRVRQVHGAAVVRACDVHDGTEADGIWTARGDGGAPVVSVTTADCVPILIASGDGAWVCAVHSGWRGTVANIAAVAIRTAAAAGHPSGSLFAAIGPCIEQDAFEVGDEVAEQFPEAHVRRIGDQKPHVDLVGTARVQLIAAGLPGEQIERVGGCTHAHPETYFSYRREGRATGQQLSFIAAQP